MGQHGHCAHPIDSCSHCHHQRNILDPHASPTLELIFAHPANYHIERIGELDDKWVLCTACAVFSSSVPQLDFKRNFGYSVLAFEHECFLVVV
jgi:hypothetical protein